MFKKIKEYLNQLFLNFNRWQGRKLYEFSHHPIDTEFYNFERQARKTVYISGKETETLLLDRLDSIKNIIRHFERSPYEDTHMLSVWVPALRATECKLTDLQISKQEKPFTFSQEMTYITNNIDRYEKILETIDVDSPVYDTIALEYKRLRARWQTLSTRHNPTDF